MTHLPKMMSLKSPQFNCFYSSHFGTVVSHRACSETDFVSRLLTRFLLQSHKLRDIPRLLIFMVLSPLLLSKKDIPLTVLNMTLIILPLFFLEIPTYKTQQGNSYDSRFVSHHKSRSKPVGIAKNTRDIMQNNSQLSATSSTSKADSYYLTPIY